MYCRARVAVECFVPEIGASIKYLWQSRLEYFVFFCVHKLLQDHRFSIFMTHFNAVDRILALILIKVIFSLIIDIDTC